KIAAAINDANIGISVQAGEDGALTVLTGARADDLTASSVKSISLEGGDSNAAMTKLTTFTPSTANSVRDMDISTALGAQSAIMVIDDAMKTIDSQRASLGAIQNRFDSTINNLQNIA